MRTVGVASVAAAAVAVLSASAPVLPSVRPPVHHSPRLVQAVPALFSFDDLAPTESTAPPRPTTHPVVTVDAAT